jgi:imidazolonepropionase
MKQVDLLVHNASQLVTCASPLGPKRGLDMGTVGVIPNGAVAILGEKIIAVGESDALRAVCQAAVEIDAGGKVVCPGFVDAHTHLVYAGDRTHEFEMRIQGASYMEIMAAGGGIANTMEATRQASLDELVSLGERRLDWMLGLGTTTVEVKTGYGLDKTSEIKMLQAIAALDKIHPVDLVATFLGAHAIPPEYKGRTDAYVDLVIEEMLPQAHTSWESHRKSSHLKAPLFNDVFCEQNAFDLAQSRRILEAGISLGMPPKIHADEFNNLGGIALAIELGAVSADHLDVTSAEEIASLAESQTVGVILPAVNFNLGSTRFAPARAMLDAGVALALATDFNPGSAPCLSMPLVMAIACRYQRLTPAETLNAATINAAHALGLGARLGSLEAGKQADLLILSLPDYRNLAYLFGVNLVETVVKRGAIVRLANMLG